MIEHDYYFLSDLHLDGDGTRRDIDRALPAFLEQLVAGATGHRRTLVLLGDTFDLHGPSRQTEAAVAERLRALVGAHAPVMEALAECVRAGVVLQVVSGNHDVEVARPGIASLMTRLLGLGEQHPGVHFSPWILHEPGVFYAEHGSQHHELNRMPTILSVREVAGGLPVTPLGACAREQPWCPTDRARVRRVARALRSELHHERLVGTDWYKELLAREAELVDLSPALLRDLAGLSAFTLSGAVFGAVERIVERRLGREPAGTYLAPRAAHVHRLLAGHGQPAAAYIFGHNHRAERLTLPGAPASAYLNAGTWGPHVRGSGPDVRDRHLFPYVRVVSGAQSVHTDLKYWDAREQTLLRKQPTAMF